MGASKLTRRRARAIARAMLAEGIKDPLEVRPGEMRSHWVVGGDYQQ